MTLVHAQAGDGEVDHGVLQNGVFDARLAQLIAQLGVLRDVQAAVVDEHGGLRALELVANVRDDALFDFKILGQFSNTSHSRPD